MTALLFVDFKTTSLNPVSCTLLECAWTVTDMDGMQRLPLRSRFLAIPSVDESIPDVPTKSLSFGSGTWMSTTGDSFAKKMAETSGLYSDWWDCPRRLRISSGETLAQLLLDDLAAVCDPGDLDRAGERVHVCGAGVARFDYSILASRCPGVTPRLGFTQPTHYRPVDTSGNQTGLLGSNYEQELIKWGVATYGEEVAKIELGTAPQYAYGDDAVMAWMVEGAGRHRAAPDVARAIVVQRVLWRYGAPLREALGVEV